MRNIQIYSNDVCVVSPPKELGITHLVNVFMQNMIVANDFKGDGSYDSVLLVEFIQRRFGVDQVCVGACSKMVSHGPVHVSIYYPVLISLQPIRAWKLDEIGACKRKWIHVPMGFPLQSGARIGMVHSELHDTA